MKPPYKHHRGSAPPPMDDAGKPIVKTKTNKWSNEIRDLQYSTKGDKSAGVVVPEKVRKSDAYRQMITGESDRSVD